MPGPDSTPLRLPELRAAMAQTHSGKEGQDRKVAGIQADHIDATANKARSQAEVGRGVARRQG